MVLTFAHLRAVNVARSTGRDGWNHPMHAWSLDEWLLAVAGELGEACNVVKKLNRARDGIIGNSRTPDQLLADLADELADTVIYLDLFAHAAGLGVYCPANGGPDFIGLRHDTIAGWQVLPVPAGIVRRALIRLGVIADCLGHEELGNVAIWTVNLLAELDAIASAYRIDLGAAVVAKFNATSEKYGMPYRLEVA